MNASDKTIRQWQDAYSRRHGYWAILVLLFVLAAWVAYCAVMIDGLGLAVLSLILVSPLLIAVHRAGIDLALWYSPRFRQAAWPLARAFGKIRLWLSRVWPLFLLTALALFLQYLSLPEGGATIANILEGLHPRTLFATTRGFEVIAVALLMIGIYQVYLARNQIVFEEFKNCTGSKARENIHQGLSIRLYQQLSAISKLYALIDEARPESGKQEEYSALGMSINLTGDDLKNAVSADAKVSLGPFGIPVGAALALFSRLVQGPRLGGSVHEENGKLFLVAHLSGGGRKGCWRAELGNGPEPQDRSDSLEQLIEQLAYRISTDLLPVGSPRWEAIYHYTEGLRAYRRSLVAGPEEQSLFLDTEKSFIRALSMDRQFAQCHYNLGILYRQMNGRQASAQTALRLAVEEAPQNFDAYYALALNYMNSKRWDDALWFCEQTIRLRPACAAPWNLKGYVSRQAREERLGRPLKAGGDQEDWQEIIPIREAAAALALRECSISALRGTLQPRTVDIAVISTRNAAVAQAMIHRFGNSAHLFRQAIQLSDTDDNADLYFEFGKTLLERQDFKGAAEAFDHVYENGLRSENRPAFWAYRAYAQFRLSLQETNKKDDGRLRGMASLDRFCNLAVDLILPERNDTVSTVLETSDDLIEKLIQEDEAFTSRRIGCRCIIPRADVCREGRRKIVEEWRHRNAFLRWLDQADQTALERMLSVAAVLRLSFYSFSPLDKWEIALTKLKLAHILASPTNTLNEKCLGKARERAITYFKEAIDALTPNHMQLITSQGWYGHLANALLRNNQPKEALEFAEQAVRHDPEASWEWGILGSVYHALGDYARAENAWDTALSFDPTDKHSIQDIAQARWEKGVATTNAENRRREFEHVITRFQQTRTLLDLDGTRNAEEAAFIHFWIGRFQQELLRTDEAVANLTISKKLGFAPIWSRVALGWVYLEANDYTEADKWFLETCNEIWDRRPNNWSGSQDWLSEPPMQPGTTNVEPGEENFSIGTWLVEAQLGLAYSTVLRNETVPNAVLDKALRRAFWSERLCLQTMQPMDRPAFQAACHTVKALVAYRKGSLVESCRHLDEAISIHPDPRSYRYLAEIYLMRAKCAHPDWQRLAQEALRRAREADRRGLFTGDLDRLSAALSAPPDKAKPA